MHRAKRPWSRAPGSEGPPRRKNDSENKKRKKSKKKKKPAVHMNYKWVNEENNFIVLFTKMFYNPFFSAKSVISMQIVSKISDSTYIVER